MARRQTPEPLPKPTRDEAMNAAAGILLIGLKRRLQAEQERQKGGQAS